MFVNIHTHHITQQSYSIYNVFAQQYNAVYNNYISMGLHPWHINQVNINHVIECIKNNASNTNILAIGECGLDKIINTNFEIQLQVFIEQIRIAQTHNKPLIIHCVKAFNQLIALKNEYNNNIAWIVHGYRNNLTIAQQLINNNFYLGFGSSLTTAHNAIVFKQIPLQNIFLETDNSEMPINEIYKLASRIKQISVSEIELAIEQNFKKVFVL